MDTYPTHSARDETAANVRVGTSLGVRSLLIIIAVICFIVAALGIDVGRISVLAVGLAFFAASFLVDETRWPR